MSTYCVAYHADPVHPLLSTGHLCRVFYLSLLLPMQTARVGCMATMNEVYANLNMTYCSGFAL